MDPFLFLIGGLPGAGKSTLAKMLALPTILPIEWKDGATSLMQKTTLVPPLLFEADDFFLDEGIYRFEPTRLSDAHASCLRKTRRALEEGNNVVVANTFSRRWERAPYLKLKEEKLCRTLIVIDLFDAGLSDWELAQRTQHHVPQETISAMRKRWEHRTYLDPR